MVLVPICKVSRLVYESGWQSVGVRLVVRQFRGHIVVHLLVRSKIYIPVLFPDTKS
jgi:hypothetical protein